MARRSLLDDDHEDADIFGDEYEVEDGVVDGFRPQNHDREGADHYYHDRVTSAAAFVASPTDTTAGPSRDSTRKSRPQQDPFADSHEAPLVRTPSGNFDMARRSTSSASSSHFARSSSPRFGSGPSHPYNMYAQGTVARSASSATASTVRPQRHSSSRLQQPQHPYAMYTQGVGDEFEDEPEAAPAPVPVGFIGMGEQYERRRGPDGEEQDLLGAFGHTEQLPPYSRYPEDGPEKMPLLDVPNIPTAMHTRAPVLGTDPGMELMHAQLSAAAAPPPSQQSMMDPSQLDRRSIISSRRSLAPSVHSNSQNALLSDGSSDGEKPWSKKNWREKRSHRVFKGIPCWWLIAITGVLVFISAMLGGVLGGFLEGQKKGQANAIAQQAQTSLYDASIIVTSTTKAPPATGTFALPLGAAQATQASCLIDASQETAWQCDLVGEADIQIVIETPTGSEQPGAFLNVDVEGQYYMSYGSQRSSMSTQFSPFLLVTDLDAPEYGAAYYFQQQYNKMVLIPDQALDVTTGKIKRDHMNVPDGYTNRKQYAAPEDQPWLCYWNNTFMEGFIYPDVPVTSFASTISSALPPTTAVPSSSGGWYNMDNPVTTPWAVASAQPTDDITTTVKMLTTSCVYTGQASGFPDYMSSKYPGWYESDGVAYPPAMTGPPDSQTTGTKRSADTFGSRKRNEANDNDNDPGPYPYLVKIEERRLPGSPRAYCNKIQILDDMNWNFLPDTGDQVVTIQLAEVDPGYQAYLGGDNKKLRKRRLVSGECHCQWQSGNSP